MTARGECGLSEKFIKFVEDLLLNLMIGEFPRFDRVILRYNTQYFLIYINPQNQHKKSQQSCFKRRQEDCLRQTAQKYETHTFALC